MGHTVGERLKQHTLFVRISRVQIDTRCHEVNHVQQAADRDTQQAFDGKTRNDAKREAGSHQTEGSWNIDRGEWPSHLKILIIILSSGAKGIGEQE